MTAPSISPGRSRRRNRKEETPKLPLPPEIREELYMRTGRRSIYAKITDSEGRVFHRSTRTTFKSSAQQWLEIAKKELARTGTLPAAPSHRKGGEA